MMRRYYREVVARGKEGVQPTFVVEGQSHVRIFLCIGAFMILHSRVPRVAFYVAKKTRVDRGNHDCFPTQSRRFSSLSSNPGCYSALLSYFSGS